MRAKRLLTVHKEKLLFLFSYFFSFLLAFSQSNMQTTYCNTLNVDYTYMIYNAHNNISYRSGADPAVVKFRGE
ncbi:MAG: hypothetical protein ICV81_21695, partial [Flavisolibacter sp.]|nr:hypothetical protein [Flavisolibacter sp.]